MAGGSSEKYYISSETTDGYINDEILIEFNFASPQGTPVSNLYVNDVSVIYVFEDNELIDTFDFLSKYNGFNYIPTTIGTHTIFCTTENNPNSTNKSNTLTFTIKSKGIWDNAISKIVNGIKNLINNHNTDINSHSSLFDAKVNVSDIKDNLTSTDTNKPLSANQGKSLKGLIDEKADVNSIPTKTSDLTNDSGFLTQHQSLTDYLQKSNTVGLVKNDGTIDTNTYLTTHQSLSNYYTKSEIDNLIGDIEEDMQS